MQQAVICAMLHNYIVIVKLVWSTPAHSLVHAWFGQCALHNIAGYDFYLHLTVTHAMMSPEAPTNAPMMPIITPVTRGVVQPVKTSALINIIIAVHLYQHDHPYNAKRMKRGMY